MGEDAPEEDERDEDEEEWGNPSLSATDLNMRSQEYAVRKKKRREEKEEEEEEERSRRTKEGRKEEERERRGKGAPAGVCALWSVQWERAMCARSLQQCADGQQREGD